jgi:Cu2+-containing amine oxidase
MALNRLKQAASHFTAQAAPQHPFDPLSEAEIEQAVAIIRKEHKDVHFNAVTLWEPRKAEMMKWIKDPKHTPRPSRVADVVCIGRGSKVFDGHVDLNEGKIVSWTMSDGVQPLVLHANRTQNTLCSNSEDRLPWKISRLSKASCERTSRSSSNVGSLAYLRKTCTKSIVIVW